MESVKEPMDRTLRGLAYAFAGSFVAIPTTVATVYNLIYNHVLNVPYVILTVATGAVAVKGAIDLYRGSSQTIGFICDTITDIGNTASELADSFDKLSEDYRMVHGLEKRINGQ